MSVVQTTDVFLLCAEAARCCVTRTRSKRLIAALGQGQGSSEPLSRALCAMDEHSDEVVFRSAPSGEAVALTRKASHVNATAGPVPGNRGIYDDLKKDLQELRETRASPVTTSSGPDKALEMDRLMAALRSPDLKVATAGAIELHQFIQLAENPTMTKATIRKEFIDKVSHMTSPAPC